jgi:predicted O-methyltransferase YrrM
LWFGLATVLGFGQRGYFIPYRYAGNMPGPGHRQAYGAVERLFDAHRSIFEATLERVNDQAAALQAIGADDPAPDPRWHQDWFPRLDAAVAYAMVRAAEPSRIIEVGSGHSTRFLARAIADAGLATRLTAIDPAPRASILELGVEVVDQPVNRVDPDLFARLAPGDVLFIDSSHILMPGSDVDLLVNHIMPDLAQGVLVHVHDIFLPDDYPTAWAWRGYGEQLALVGQITSGAWQPLFASRYMVTRWPETLAKSAVGPLPLMPGALETSLWLRRR